MAVPINSYNVNAPKQRWTAPWTTTRKSGLASYEDISLTGGGRSDESFLGKA
jgi:hypothetical protein